MTFNIDDDPIAPTDARSLIPDWFMDQAPLGITEKQAAHDYAYHMISHFGQPKMMKTVRVHFLARSAFFARLAEIDGDLFDEVMCAYAERALTFNSEMSAHAA